MHYRFVYACNNSSANASTSCERLVKISPVTLVENRQESGNCAAARLLYYDRQSFSTLAFENGLDYIAILI